jgi:hypothetical protein
MSDDKSKIGKPDRDRVNPNEKYEVDQVRKKYPSVPADKVLDVIKKAPHQKRDWIERELDKLVK